MRLRRKKFSHVPSFSWGSMGGGGIGFYVYAFVVIEERDVNIGSSKTAGTGERFNNV